MKSIPCLLCVALAGFSPAPVAAGTNLPAIIPVPQHLQSEEGVFRLTPKTRIHVDAGSETTGRLLAQQLRRATGFPLPVEVESSTPGPVHGDVSLSSQDTQTARGPEGYQLAVTPEAAVIRAAAPAGAFYGAQSLLQLLPPKIMSSGMVTGVDWTMPCVRIEDQPRFQWRGMMLDVSRHFFTKQEVEKLLDVMAVLKLNRFHWHLVDDQGWRIEIKRYPRLTQIGAWRPGIGFKLDPKSSTAYGPDGRYGGYYTQSDIREVVAYAQARHITIVPEIEMPGHSTAALEAYPQFSCTGGPFTQPLVGGVFNGIYCPGNDAAFEFVENILSEVFQLFPGKYIHVGGDEVPTDNWKHCAKCQARMKAEGLTQERQLESYFIQRIEKFVNAHGKTLIGWSEIREGGLAKNAVIMDWIGGAEEAATNGHDVVMTPTDTCYFDKYQSANHATEPYAIGGYLPLSKVYSMEPIPAGLPLQFQSHILGVQANVWTEYMPSLRHVEYMVFPRLCALAEVAWSPANSRNWNDFMSRLEQWAPRLDAMGVNYRRRSLEEADIKAP
jgi:hexosaminidase